ncbi:uncharacterized protein LOC106669962 [Cimex lectularius]|uniref:BED-type domain-containing protein n=1 Tax=Cimex lectularius TaxID=79782 RepID=A0A8I6TGE2_CIMLE|nr:uncharacterized protein LOC106669962 [Cimex lectularius]XP_014255375.1 uncharacterized protein LOC106669962 [Cimex lectularius]
MKMKKTSFVWNHFTTVQKGKYMCNYCKSVLSTANGSTGNLKRHLRVRHPHLNEFNENFSEALTEEMIEKGAEKNVNARDNSSMIPTTTILPSHEVESNDRKRKCYDKPQQIKSRDQVDNTFSVMHNAKNNAKYTDDFTLYGKNVTSRMRNACKSPRAIASAKNQIDNILFKLEMGEFDDACSAENVGNSGNYPLLTEFITVRSGEGESNTQDVK